MDHAAERAVPGIDDERRLAGNPARIAGEGQRVVVVHRGDVDLAAVGLVVAVAARDDVEFAAEGVAGVVGSLAEPAA